MTKSFVQERAEKMIALRAEKMAQHLASKTEDKQTDMRPMHERVAAVLKRLTPEELTAGIRLEWLCEQLAGKYRGHAQPKAVGAALRRLGFRRVRSWRGDDIGFRATWHPVEGGK